MESLKCSCSVTALLPPDLTTVSSNSNLISSEKRQNPPSPNRYIAGHSNTIQFTKIEKKLKCTCGAISNNTNKVNENSPKREFDGRKVTRGVGTSPQLDLPVKQAKKSHLSPMKSIESNTNSNRVLEKSNSVGENKPQRQLRTTRSLSPRPPIKHQYAITVCDENDVVSVKLSPNNDFDDILNQNTGKSEKKEIRKKAQSENTSPNLSDAGVFTYDDAVYAKGSENHLVYVPSDPWMKMSDDSGTIKKSPKLKGRGKESCDPWVYRSSSNIVDGKKNKNFKHLVLDDARNQERIWQSTNNISNDKKMKNPKQLAYRQAKSEEEKQVKLCKQKTATGSKLNIPDNKESIRPKLHRSKSPIITDDDLTKKSPKKLEVSPQRNLTEVSKKSTLNVINSNLLQPRHSFSTTPTVKDEELQLNIRRLSEQIRYTPSYLASPPLPQFSKQQQQVFDDKKPLLNVSLKTSIVKLDDPVFETTC